MSRNYDHKELLKAHVWLSETSVDMPGLGVLQKIAFKHNVAIENIRAYRISETEWRVYKLRNKRGKFKSQPMLP
jgi:hypothetical protein